MCILYIRLLFPGPAQGIFSQSSLQPQNNQTTQQQLINTQLLISSVTMPALFQDERDVIVKKFNQLGAYCGAGMGLASYGGQAQLVEFQPSNPLARFKVCYAVYLLLVTNSLYSRPSVIAVYQWLKMRMDWWDYSFQRSAPFSLHRRIQLPSLYRTC